MNDTKPFQPRYKFNSDEEWCEYNKLDLQKEYKTTKQPIGWAMYEAIAIGLINVCKCNGPNGCGRLINYNGLPPQYCISCKEPIDFYKERMKFFTEEGSDLQKVR